jgi:hypothetical protein
MATNKEEYKNYAFKIALKIEKYYIYYKPE